MASLLPLIFFDGVKQGQRIPVPEKERSRGKLRPVQFHANKETAICKMSFSILEFLGWLQYTVPIGESNSLDNKTEEAEANKYFGTFSGPGLVEAHMSLRAKREICTQHVAHICFRKKGLSNGIFNGFHSV